MTKVLGHLRRRRGEKERCAGCKSIRGRQSCRKIVKIAEKYRKRREKTKKTKNASRLRTDGF